MAEDNGMRRLKAIMDALGPITGTEEERMAESLRRFDVAHGITPADVEEMQRRDAAAWEQLTGEERAQVAEIEAEADAVREAWKEMHTDSPTIQ